MSEKKRYITITLVYVFTTSAFSHFCRKRFVISHFNSGRDASFFVIIILLLSYFYLTLQQVGKLKIKPCLIWRKAMVTECKLI